MMGDAYEQRDRTGKLDDHSQLRCYVLENSSTFLAKPTWRKRKFISIFNVSIQ
jgi:hypothetical protein